MIDSTLKTAQLIAFMIARDLRAEPSRWTIETRARDKAGQRVPWWSEDAYSNCLLGHIVSRLWRMPQASGYCRDSIIAEFKRHITGGYPLWGLAAWNDHPGRTVEEVIDLCERVAGIVPTPLDLQALHRHILDAETV